ncbi:MAG: 2-oxoacid ferredoxin oxidoreductase [Candidatus Chisholmbacteria bacterium RIFCSPLOWO2_01_FULL_50_28]|uniref:2-oxoacid ferredoxin oxidoreductase n=1 Tax=Candidatus Chisholmbacteria bacterium RIFCSPHIGHO2_01_FULL_52_32 TaxID=1797591 RepID=A0A1G1VSJ1_9BACT|nr:MAG: 2-oxoacid ferredoxin oxidoreductase [Candidatus Chisholmbacteria bacterium RIFCSPHIGHO2_01_FULL_52_32]OGY20256.1 MAG: 2-oxoacid ferredoxin oxidoreductase [Candidatus Chisholmbacteria bacterium RIFCSPLOWO2_01_FULL_50_28]
MPEEPPKQTEYQSTVFPTWCPGCGDFGIWGSLKNSLVSLNLHPWQFVVVFGIGCSGNMADFFHAHGFHALHGRGIPNATAIKLTNHTLPVIIVAGDGDTYGEGMGHFIAAARGNHDITVIVHNNQVYGLTTGQSAPTTTKGTKTKSTPGGTIEIGVNPMALAISSGATFVSRAFSGDMAHTAGLIKQAVEHKGFALVDILQPCVTFNRINTYDWYRQRVYKLDDEGYTPTDRTKAFAKALEEEKIPLGIFYREEKPAYHEEVTALKEKPLVEQSISSIDLAPALEEFL